METKTVNGLKLEKAGATNAAEPFVCPNCAGNGKRLRELGSETLFTICQSCNGKGILWR